MIWAAPVVAELGIRVRQLAIPVRIEQVDGSLLEGAPATLVTEPVRLEMGAHWEVLQFIMVPSMTEAVILGLAWLDKWGHTIWWEGGYRKLRIGIGPLPPPHEQAQKSLESKGEGKGGGETGGNIPLPVSVRQSC